jgi:hypothetical protein
MTFSVIIITDDPKFDLKAWFGLQIFLGHTNLAYVLQLFKKSVCRSILDTI